MNLVRRLHWANRRLVAQRSTVSGGMAGDICLADDSQSSHAGWESRDRFAHWRFRALVIGAGRGGADRVQRRNSTIGAAARLLHRIPPNRLATGRVDSLNPHSEAVCRKLSASIRSPSAGPTISAPSRPHSLSIWIAPAEWRWRGSPMAELPPFPRAHAAPKSHLLAVTGALKRLAAPKPRSLGSSLHERSSMDRLHIVWRWRNRYSRNSSMRPSTQGVGHEAGRHSSAPRKRRRPRHRSRAFIPTISSADFLPRCTLGR